jgi:thiol-disulfide isomerase/thioredoxin
MNGDFVDGKIVSLPVAGKLSWLNPSFAEPMQIDVATLASIDVPVEVTPLPKDDGFAIRTHAGDRLWGELKGWSPEALTLQPKNLSSVELDPKSIAQMKRWSQGQEILYQGPQSIDEWKPLDETYKWQMQFGSLMSTDNGAKVRGNLHLPDKCQIDIRISWQKQPNFVIAFGVDETQTSAGKAFSFEVWDDKLALVRDIGTKADAAFLQTLDQKKMSIELSMFLDQVSGRAVVFSDQGKMLADIQLAADDAKPLPCILIENFGRELRIDQIRVLSWTDQMPSERRQFNDYVMDRTGKVYEGRVASMNAESGVIVKASDGSESTISLADVLEVVQSEVADPPAAEKAQATSDTADSTNNGDEAKDASATDSAAKVAEVQSTILLRDQTRLFGVWMQCADDKIQFKPNCARQSITVPLSELVAFQVTKSAFKASTSAAKEGQLFLDGVQLQGILDASEVVPSATCLKWKSRLVENALSITENAEGRIDFRRLDQRVPPVSLPPQRNNGRPVLMGGPAGGASAAKKAGVPNIKLRTGEVILAEVKRIDEKGVTFESSTTKTTFVPNERIQSIEIRRVKRDKVQAAQKMARLLTVPRMKKNDPPTHIVSSVDGDFLRGRLTRLDENGAAVEVRTTESVVPLDSISQIIWLHDRNWDASKPATAEESNETVGTAKPEEPKNPTPAEADPNAGIFQVHLVEKAGWRMTFQPKLVSAEAISGINDLLGECSIELKSVEMILIGKSLQPKIREFVDNPWSLSLAKQPKVYDDAEAEANPSLAGTQSPLVGKPAPKLEGETLDGGTFKLSEQKGKIIVLDFWASWCGPCMQTMPLVDAAVRELNNPDVSLVAVNLEEPSERAQAALDRLKLETQVVLDIDGAAGQRYQANAIPQTVIVDREGVVRHVFVGGGPKLVPQLMGAIESLLATPATP